jgi:hypothetical protein
VTEHDKLKDKLLPTITQIHSRMRNLPFLYCDVVSSFKCPQAEIVNSFLREEWVEETLVWKPIFQMLEKVKSTSGMRNINPDGLIIESGWYNIYDEKIYQEMHNHDGNVIIHDNKQFHPFLSIIYVLNNPNELNDTVFRINESPCYPRKSAINFDTSTEPGICEGSVIIFPSDIPHMVKPSIKPGRVTIAYNVYASFDSAPFQSTSI